MQIKTKISIISTIFVCFFFVVSCGGSSKTEEPKNDTDTETTDENEIQDDSEVSDETEPADTGEITDDTGEITDDTDSDTEEESGKASVASIKFTIPEEASTVAEDSGHFAFPDVVKLTNGKFMVVYRNGSTHADKSGAIIVSFSDDGINWGEPDILLDDETIDDRDPSITVLSDGRVAMNWFKYRYPADYSEPWIHHLFFAVSDKSGLNFGEHVQVDTGVFDYSETAIMDENGIWLDDENGSEVTVAASSSSAIEHDGKIIIPGYFGNALNWQSMGKTPKTKVVLYESSDGGKTWTPNDVKAEIDEKTWLQEPALLKITDKRWILHVRTGVGASPSNKGDLVQSISEDGGKTWSAYKSLGFAAHAPELLKLENGVIISSFRWLDWTTSVNREAVSMVYSLDGGETWSDVIEILDCGKSECGYPGMVELPDNKILVVYYTPGGREIKSKIITFEAE